MWQIDSLNRILFLEFYVIVHHIDTLYISKELYIINQITIIANAMSLYECIIKSLVHLPTRNHVNDV